VAVLADVTTVPCWVQWLITYIDRQASGRGRCVLVVVVNSLLFLYLTVHYSPALQSLSTIQLLGRSA